MTEQRYEYTADVAYQGRFSERERIVRARSEHGWRLITMLIHPPVEGETVVELWFERPYAPPTNGQLNNWPE